MIHARGAEDGVIRGTVGSLTHGGVVNAKKVIFLVKMTKRVGVFVIGIVLIVKPCLVMMVGILCASENGDGDDGEEMTCLAFSHYPKSESQSERPPNEHIFFAISQHLGVKQGNVSIRGC